MTDVAIRTDEVTDDTQRALEAVNAIKARAADMAGSSFAALLKKAEDSGTLDVLITREVRDRETLVGVPFFVTGIKFNPGINNSDFVSLEITPMDGAPCVINDGSTGIRRQIVQWLTETQKLIDPGKSIEDPNTGEIFDRYDNPVSVWAKGQDIAHSPGFGPFEYLIPRGTRKSEYANPAGGNEPSVTWYLS